MRVNFQTSPISFTMHDKTEYRKLTQSQCRSHTGYMTRLCDDASILGHCIEPWVCVTEKFSWRIKFTDAASIQHHQPIFNKQQIFNNNKLVLVAIIRGPSELTHTRFFKKIDHLLALTVDLKESRSSS